MLSVLVTSYVNPDLDGLAGATAYAELLNAKGRRAVAAFFGKPHNEALYVLDRFDIVQPTELSSSEEFNEVILIDCSEVNHLEGNIPLEKVIEIIDHRKVNDADKFPNATTQIELVGAAATLVAEKFIQSNIPISLNSAVLLHAAIISSTLNFKASVTTDRDKNVFTWLKDMTQLGDEFVRELFSKNLILLVLNLRKPCVAILLRFLAERSKSPLPS